MENVRIGIVLSEFNYDITFLMLQRAVEHANFLEAQVTYIYRVPGSFDIPIAVKKLLERDDVDAVVTLGAIVEGDTEHDSLIGHQTARKIVDLSVEYDKPVGLGVSGPGMTRLQGMDRIDEYARRAVEGAVKQAKRSRRFKQTVTAGANKYPIEIS